jgi:hypothetical protein
MNGFDIHPDDRHLINSVDETLCPGTEARKLKVVLLPPH